MTVPLVGPNGEPVEAFWLAGISITVPISGTIAVSNFPATVATNTGNSNASTIRVVLATNQPNFTTALNVQVTNTPAVTVTGSVSVSNFPATQPVSGTVAVSNFPATQPVSGTVAVSNFPATQPVSGTVTVAGQSAGASSGQQNATSASGKIPTGGTLANRKTLILRNTDATNSVFVNINAASTTAKFELIAGAVVILPTGLDVFLITASATVRVDYMESA